MGFGGCADRLVLPPVVHSTPIDGTTRRTITQTEAVVEVFTARSPGAADTTPQAFVLRFTGGDASAAAAFTASRWQHRPVEVWVANYPGYSGSSGPRTLKSLASAALACFDELKHVAADRPVFLEGFSLGTVPALHVAANRPVDGMILQNPPPLRQLILSGHGWWNLWLIAGPVALQVPPEFDSISNAARSKAPVLYVLAEKDRTIPLAYQQRIAESHAGLKRLVIQSAADHVEPLNDADEAKLHESMDWLLSRANTVR
jgi:pimeloyl-ACP methyl ester carboxylesterase